MSFLPSASNGGTYRSGYGVDEGACEGESSSIEGVKEKVLKLQIGS